MLEVIKYNRRGRRWRFDCNTIQLRNVYSQKFHTNRNIANNIKFKIDESSGVLSEKHFHFKFPALSITGQYVKCRLQND